MIRQMNRGLARGMRMLGAGWVLAAIAACGGGGGSIGTLSLATHQLAFATTLPGSAPPYQTIQASVTGFAGPVLYLKVVVQGDAVTVDNVTVTSDTSGQATVTPVDPRLLGPGQHTATLMVYACTSSVDCTTGNLSGSPQRVDVTYTINGLTTDSTGLEYTIGNAVAPTDLVRTAALVHWPDANYAIASDVPWLTAVQQAGATAGASTLEGDLDAAQVDALDDGVYTGHVTVTPRLGDPVVLPVTLTVARTDTRYVSPRAEAAGTAAEVVLRGDHLDLVQVNGVRFGDQAAPSFRVVSPTEIRATHPALQAGRYPVTLQTSGGLSRDRAVLTVYDPVAPAAWAGTLAYPADPNPWHAKDAVLDTAGQALFVLLHENGGAYHDHLVRYAHDASGWHLTGDVVADGADRIALSADGAVLVAAGGQPAIQHFDATTLATLPLAPIAEWFGDRVTSLSLTNDGTLVETISSGGDSWWIRYEVRTGTYLGRPADTTQITNYEGVASLDGSSVLIGSDGGGVANQVPGLLYDAGTAATTSLPTSLLPLTAQATDRTGTRFVTGYADVRDRAMNLLVSLPAGTGVSGATPSLSGTTMSADGHHVHGLDALFQLRSFRLDDVGASVVATEVGQPLDVYTSVGFPVRCLLSADDGTLFVIGHGGVLVMAAR